MNAGEEVIYKRHAVLYGVCRIVRQLPDGRLRVRSSDDQFYEFDRSELVTYQDWQKRKAKQAA